MDKQTQSYRLAQIAKLKHDDNYPSTIKLYGSKEGQTNNLDISKDEFISICQILTENR